MTLLQSSTVTVEESLDDIERASNEARTRQLAQLCHEIRNPLFGVIGNLQELDLDLNDGSATPGAVALVATTLACTAQLRRTLDDFLDLAKADAATLRVVRGPTRLRPLLVEVSRQVLRAAHEKGLAVYVHVQPELADKVFLLDPGRLSQVLSNFAWVRWRSGYRGPLARADLHALSILQTRRTASNLPPPAPSRCATPSTPQQAPPAAAPTLRAASCLSFSKW
jgi:nitrogen-specific signal transduction histidine kinase